MWTVTVTDILEHVFCPRFTYFEKTLAIPEHQEIRVKVQKGRTLHSSRAKRQRSYIRTSLPAHTKRVNEYLSSKDLHLRGEIDEILVFKDGSASPLDYKYAEAPKKIYRTHKVQITLYGLLIEANYPFNVEKGFLCYVRTGFKLHEVEITPRLRKLAIGYIKDFYSTVHEGCIPEAKAQEAKCTDCCYRRLCAEQK